MKQFERPPSETVMVTEAVPDLFKSAVLAAVIVRAAGFGTTAGAAYRPLEEIGCWYVIQTREQCFAVETISSVWFS